MRTSGVRSRSDIFTVAVVVGCAAYVLALGFMPGFREVSPLACFINRAIGLHCPTCGLTRAAACCARLEFASAVRFNPLIVLVAPITVVYVADLLLRMTGRSGPLAAVPAAVVAAAWVALATVSLLLLVVRTATWIMPGLNPDGWLMPPASFPEV